MKFSNHLRGRARNKSGVPRPEPETRFYLNFLSSKIYLTSSDLNSSKLKTHRKIKIWKWKIRWSDNLSGRVRSDCWFSGRIRFYVKIIKSEFRRAQIRYNYVKSNIRYIRSVSSLTQRLRSFYLQVSPIVWYTCKRNIRVGRWILFPLNSKKPPLRWSWRTRLENFTWKHFTLGSKLRYLTTFAIFFHIDPLSEDL